MLRLIKHILIIAILAIASFLLIAYPGVVTIKWPNIEIYTYMPFLVILIIICFIIYTLIIKGVSKLFHKATNSKQAVTESIIRALRAGYINKHEGLALIKALSIASKKKCRVVKIILKAAQKQNSGKFAESAYILKRAQRLSSTNNLSNLINIRVINIHIHNGAKALAHSLAVYNYKQYSTIEGIIALSKVSEQYKLADCAAMVLSGISKHKMNEKLQWELANINQEVLINTLLDHEYEDDLITHKNLLVKSLKKYSISKNIKAISERIMITDPFALEEIYEHIIKNHIKCIDDAVLSSYMELLKSRYNFSDAKIKINKIINPKQNNEFYNVAMVYLHITFYEIASAMEFIKALYLIDSKIAYAGIRNVALINKDYKKAYEYQEKVSHFSG